MPVTLYERAEEALRLAEAAGLAIVTAESCTGGMIAAALTEVPGASRAFDRGFVTYSNAAKTKMLKVPAQLIEAHGAVSEEVAAAMAEGALKASGAALAVAVTGVAGPDGGIDAKPVGLVYIAAARKGAPTMVREKRFGDLGRQDIRRKSTYAALVLLAEAAGKTEPA